MKKKIMITIVLCLLIFVLFIIYKENSLYERYRYPDEEFYGKDLYSEIKYRCSEYESEVGNMIVDRAFEVARYTGTEQDAEAEMGDVGALSIFYYFHDKRVVSQKVDFKFITCKITENEGHVWVVYTQVGYDDSGTRATLSFDILSLWYIEKDGDEWYVVRIQEAP